MSARSQTSIERLGDAAFHDTVWSRVFAAGSEDSGEARAARDLLCGRYWYPIYAFLRRWGHDRDRARDLTQAFFAFVLQNDLFGTADPQKGRFRSFLLKSLRNFVLKERAKDMAMKRGGANQIISIDDEAAEIQYRAEPFTELTPEKLFDRRWAYLVIEQALQRLEAEYKRSGLEHQFQAARPYLTGEGEAAFAELGASLGKSAGAVRIMVCRLRNRFREHIREVIAETVQDTADVDLELAHLQAALRT